MPTVYRRFAMSCLSSPVLRRLRGEALVEEVPLLPRALHHPLHVLGDGVAGRPHRLARSAAVRAKGSVEPIMLMRRPRPPWARLRGSPPVKFPPATRSPTGRMGA